MRSTPLCDSGQQPEELVYIISLYFHAGRKLRGELTQGLVRYLKSFSQRLVSIF